MKVRTRIVSVVAGAMVALAPLGFMATHASAAGVPPVASGTTTGADGRGGLPANPGQYSMIFLQPWQNTEAATVTADGSVPIEYKDLTSTRENDCGASPAGGSPCVVNNVICPTGTNDASQFTGGLGFCDTWRNHPEYFLTNDGTTATHSTPVSNLHKETNFPTQYEMDYGNVNYQNAWAAAVIAQAPAQGFGWVGADNALVTATAYGTVPLYNTDAKVQTATRAMLANVGPKLIAAGIGINANVGFTNLYPNIWADWMQFTSGLANENGVGNVAQNHTDCHTQFKTCWFSSSGFTPTFSVDNTVAQSLPAPGGTAELNQENVSWGAVTGADHYSVQLLSNTGALLRDRTTTAASWTWTPLTSGTTYKWHVAAVDANGVVGPYSASISFTAGG